MRQWYSGNDFLQASAHQKQETLQALRYNAELARRHHLRRAEVSQRYSQALEELLAALLPALAPDALHRAAQLTGYVPLLQPSVMGELQAERARLEERIAQIEPDPRFVHREFLRTPRIGKLTREVDEILEHRVPFVALLRDASHPRIDHLIANGYGTPEYKVPFWRLSYYNDWEASDQILQFFPGKTFAELRDEYIKARDTNAAFEARLADLHAEIAAGEALEREYLRSKEALATVDQRHLQRARHYLGRHVTDCGFRVLGPRLAADPSVEVLAKRVSGLGHKLTYLDQLGEAHLTKAEQELKASLQKTERNIQKYMRPKNFHAQIPAQVFQKTFQPRGARYNKGWQRYQHASDTVYVFDRYDRANLVQDFLWWDLMTDGRIDGDFLPEVIEHRRRYPDYSYRRRDDDDDDDHRFASASAAVAVSEPISAGVDDDIHHDPS
jgi:hypothetical protein